MGAKNSKKVKKGHQDDNYSRNNLSLQKGHQDDNYSRNSARTHVQKPSTRTDSAAFPGAHGVHTGILPYERPKKPSTRTDSAAFPGAHGGHTGIFPGERPKKSAPRVMRLCDNLDFYQNKIASKPVPGYKIEDMLKWQGDYTMLERNHRYIQWLFPIPEGSGMNFYAQPLMDHEAKAMQENDSIQKRVLSAYKMMLDFYGMRLTDDIHGTVARSNKGCKERYEHLNWSRHNYLRITRILKSIGELGYERFQAPWVNFLIEESVVNGALPNLNGGCLNHWISAVINEEEQEMLFRKANGLPVNQQNLIYDMNSEGEEDTEENETEEGAVANVTEEGAVANVTEEGAVANVTALAKAEVQYDIAKMMEYDKEDGLSRLKLENIEGIAAKTDSSVLGQKHEDNNEADIAKSKHIDKENSKSELPSDNLLFYRDLLHSRPAPVFTMQTILRYKGERAFIEDNPYVIQWMFPTKDESRTNKESQVLHEHEAQAIKADDKLNSRVLEAYEMMLGFYGMKLIDTVSGKIARNSKYKEGFKHLNAYPINYMRITRILKSLGELGYERFQVPWIDFIVTYGIDNGLLTTLKGAYIMHWINAIQDKGEQQAMYGKYQALASLGEDDIEEGEDMEFDTDVYAPADTGYSAHGSQPSTKTVAPSSTSVYNSKQHGHNLNRTEDRVNMRQPSGGQVAFYKEQIPKERVPNQLRDALNF